MNIGQKSFVVFASRFGSSAVGFAAMVYIARHLGSEVLGVYFLVITVVSWLKLGCDMGIKISITKRISEGKDKSEHAIAGLALITGAFLIVSVGVLIFNESFNRYLGAPLYYYVILILGARVAHMYIGAVVRGENLVHLEGILKLINTISTRGSQIFLATFLGLGTVGILIGEMVGFVLISIWELF
jgi:O-antigen/teichoic acid export membrane protein